MEVKVITSGRSNDSPPNSSLARLENELQVLESSNDDTKYAKACEQLGMAYYESFEHMGNIYHLHQAIRYLNIAVGRTSESDPDQLLRRCNLGHFLSARFERLRNIDDLHQALQSYNCMLELIQEVHPVRGKALLYSDLGGCLNSLFQQLGNINDLQQSIQYLKYAVHLSFGIEPGDKLPSACHNNLANALLNRFRHLHDINDLHHAINHQQLAVDLMPESQNLQTKSSIHNNLGSSLRTRYERLGNIHDLDQALHHHSRAVELAPDGHISKPLFHNNLGNSSAICFERLGNIDALHQALHHHNCAVELTPDGHPDKPLWHGNLGNSSLARFQRLGNITDLHQALYHHNRAVELAPESYHARPSWHSNLGISYVARYDLLNNIEDLHQALHHYKCALECAPKNHPSNHSWHNNLGSSFRARFERLGNIHDLDHALHHFHLAMELTPDEHPHKPSRHSNMGNAFRVRFERLGNIDDLDLSIQHCQHAVDRVSITNPILHRFSLNLSRALSTRLHAGDLIMAISLCISAAHYAFTSPSSRFDAAKCWAGYLHQLHGHLVPSAFDSYEVAIHELPRISWIGVPVATQLQQLLQATAIGSDAAAAALCANKPEASLEWLEQSRSVVWTQILQMRTPLDDLSEYHPSLASRLTYIRSRLDVDDSSTSVTFAHRIELAQESDRLIDEIRALPGFSRFLLPREYSELKLAASSGPVIILNSSQYRCDAFVLLSPSLQTTVPLDGCDINQLRDYQHIIRTAASGGVFREELLERAFGPGPSVPTKNEIFRILLNFIWSSIVRPCLTVLRMNQVLSSDIDSKDLLHVRWCPTGPFTFLPIHAATEFGQNGEVISRLSDTVVSSYIPTLGALLEATGRVYPAEDCKILAVMQSATPGQARLPGVDKEFKNISQRADEANIGFDSLSNDAATVDTVLSELHKYSVVHFSCHGEQDLRYPLNSGLILHDNRLTLAKLMHTKLPNAQLAFLSACETAKGEEYFPDEAIHIAGGMFAAGFRDVIATMWTIHDSTAPAIADRVYAEVFKNAKLQVDMIPLALHRAVEQLRDQNPNDFMAWIPYIHIGP